MTPGSRFPPSLRGGHIRPLAAVVLALALSACTSSPEAEPGHDGPPRDVPGELVSTSDIPGAFLWRQQITGEYGPRTVSFESVVQKKADALTVLGLTPFGSRAFVIEQRGTEFTFTKSIPDELPFPPRNMLLDIHRAWFMRLPDDADRHDGAHAGVRAGEVIVEFWRAGRVLERRFRRLDDVPAGEVVVTYGPEGMKDLEPPEEIVIENGWFGYRLVVKTVEQRRLSPDR